MKKLVISDPQWAAYRDRFAAGLGGTWRVAAGGFGLEELKAELRDADALVGLEIPPEALPAARGLKAFLYPGAGVQRAEPAGYPAGCAVLNVYEHEIGVAEYVMTAILMRVTGIVEYGASFRTGSWAGSGRTGGATHDEACGKTVGLIGYGHIGQSVARRALAFGMRVAAVADDQGELPPTAPRPHFLGRPADLPELLAQADFLVIACPLLPSTRGMLGAAQLALLKPTAYLINVSRAEIIDEEPLFAALRDGRLAGAALDVWYRYPTRGDEVLHGSALPFHELPNTLVTPHMAGWTAALVERRIARMVENLQRYEQGLSFERVVFVGTWQ